MSDGHLIGSIAELEGVIGPPMEFVRRKILTHLDDLMREFIALSPLVLVATSDASGRIDVSPKGDPAGFVQVDEAGNLLIPERPGNQLAMGFRNILGNGQIGLIFLAPNHRETLRVKGAATLRKDPEILDAMQVKGKPALLYTHVQVTECFVHCGKAFARSGLWQPETWGPPTRSIGGRWWASVMGAQSEEDVNATTERLERSYRDRLY